MRDQRSTATHRPAGRLLRWVLVVTVGEAIGFLVPAVVGVAVTAAAVGAVANPDRDGVGGIGGRRSAGRCAI
jgi:hypothetical protein